MPTALMLTLRPCDAARVPASLGRATHAAILAQIASADPAFAARLHTAEGIKPLTISNVIGLDGHGGYAWVSPASTYGLRVTVLCDRLEQLVRTWTAETLGMLLLDGVAWQVERLTADAAVHSWAGSESYESLFGGALRRLSALPQRWTLEFVTPLTFRHSRINQPLPLPELVFGSLFDRWNALAPLPLPAELRASAAELVVSQFVLRSVAAHTKHGALQIGAVGHCTYNATMPDHAWLAGIDLLAQFAFYSGIGAGTARGFGQARLIERGSRGYGKNTSTHARMDAR